MPPKKTSKISPEDAQKIQQIGRSLKQAIESAYRDGIDQILSVNLDEGDSFVGKFRDGKEVYDFTITASGKINYVESAERNDSYFVGFYLDSGFNDRTNALAHQQGFVPQQTTRSDRSSKTKQCQKGKPCGSACIARGTQCRQQLSSPDAAQITKARSGWGSLSPTAKALLIGGVATLAVAAAGTGVAIAINNTKQYHTQAASNRTDPYENPHVREFMRGREKKEGESDEQWMDRMFNKSQKNAEESAQSAQRKAEERGEDGFYDEYTDTLHRTREAWDEAHSYASREKYMKAWEQAEAKRQKKQGKGK